MKRYLLFILLLACSTALRAQQKAALSAASSSCTATSCISVSVDPTQGGTTFTVTANASGNTIQFEASGDGGTSWVALNATPSNSTTAATSTSSTGVWQANVAGYTNIRMRMSTLVGGTTTVSMIQSTASARAGGGGGVGTIAIPATVSGATSGGIPCFDSTTDMNTSGVIVVNDAITGGGAGACAKDSGIPVYTGARAAVATNTVVGVGALAANGSTTDTHESAFGNGALAAQAGTGGDNAAFGYQALNAFNGGTGSNSAVGSLAGLRVSTGTNNVMFGQNACSNTTTGTQQVCLGSNTQPNAAADTNECVIGFNFSGAGSNTCTVGNASVTDVYLGSSTPNAVAHAKGYDVVNTVLVSATAPTIAGAGCGGSAASITASNGTAAFKIGVGTAPTSACTITMPAATTGWNCWASDITTQSTTVSMQRQTGAESTTSVIITNFSDVTAPASFVANDVLKVGCLAD